MSRIRRGWALTKKSWGAAERAPRAGPLPALRRGRHDRLLAIVVVGPGLYLIDEDRLASARSRWW